MGVSSSNRGSRLIAREADAHMQAANTTFMVALLQDKIDQLTARVHELEQGLARARRCLASERSGRERLRSRLIEANQNYAFAVKVLAKRANLDNESAR